MILKATWEVIEDGDYLVTVSTKLSDFVCSRRERETVCVFVGRVFGVLLLGGGVHKSCLQTGGVRSDAGGSGGRRVGKGGKARTEGNAVATRAREKVV